MRRLYTLAVLIVAVVASGAFAQTGHQNPHGEIKWDCQQCHTLKSWHEMRNPSGFAHGETGFPLVGAHSKTRCASCHADLRFVKTESACANCHSDIHRGQLGAECQTCHTSEDWTSHRDEFEQHAERGFALVGAHAIADCGACHVNQLPREFAGAPTECAGCHGEDYAATTEPNHAMAGFSQDCESCHGQASPTWKLSRYIHPSTFPLTDGHAGATCNSCHATTYAGTSTDCFACHESDFNGAADPDHVSAGFSNRCLDCHTTVAWTPVELNHDLTSFPLTGAHVEVSCNSCHTTGYSGTTSTCVGCHEENYTTAVDPDHAAAGFPTNCVLCHNTTAWAPANLDHDLTDFPLTGAHTSVTCANCHTSGYTGTSADCYACHENDYTSTPDPDHAGARFSTECASCHTTTAWTPANLDHDITDFPLTGAHISVSCNSCHASGFTGTEGACVACHESDYTSADDPNHIAAAFPTECAQCHTTSAWSPANLDHDLTGFPLTGAHVSVTCANCHTSGYTGTSSSCNACHNADYVNTPDPDHAAAGFSTECTECHTTEAWIPATLDHNITDFPLTGAHASVSCSNCHTSGFTGTQSACVACHESDYASAEDPDHAGAGFPTECAQCHSTTAWEPANLNHDLTDFPLTGAHVSVDCNSCHTSGYTGTASACFACHSDDYANTPDPDHAAAGFPTECAMCHTTAAWKPGNLNHDLTDFPLTGAHVSVTCASCHTSGYTGTASECLACHQADYVGTSDPNHVESGFSTECTLCHTTAAWEPATIDHNATEFPLTGAHVTAACNDCHASGYTGTTTLCYACHISDFASADDPDHEASHFSNNCEGCHTTTAWEPAEFDHNLSDFPLTGAHTTVTCNNCHETGFTGTPTACLACHEDDFTATTDPDHVANGFATECTQCHSTNAWVPATLDHDLTGFPLTGAHVEVTCNSCHTTGYTGTPSACFACHETEYTQTPDPDHAAAGFSTACNECHTTSGWTPANLDHNITDFPLTGAHLAVACNTCHTTGFTGTASECLACHQSDFAGADDPSHAGFPTNCAQCHSTSAWEPATFNHDQTEFPLLGLHKSTSCASCHTSGYAGTPMVCDACHHSEYVATTDPNHVTAGFSTDCKQCHTPSGWEPATLDHNLTGFPLTGAHRTTTCNKCHASGYTGTPTTCDACHHTDYAGVADPNHTLAAFSTNCAQCHSTTNWQPSTWSHNQTGFTLTGAHQSVTCNSCHATGFANTASACYACHSSDYTAVTDPNHVTGGFPTLCEQCHTTTAWTPSSFDHNLSAFPLTGAHRSVTCNSCHSAGYTGTPTDCDACHHNDYTGVSDPNHVLAGFSTNCVQCHTTSNWDPSSWSHTQTGFTLTGAHQSVTCNSCHATGFGGTASACYACHSSDYTGVTDPNHVSGGFPTLCEQCHTTTAWTPSSFDHDLSGFPLTGAHTTVTCNSCHASGYTGTPSACDACHHSDYTGVGDPNHVTAGFSTLCEQCHTTSGWTPASFDHNQSGFPLTGAHTTVTCNSCHSAGYTGTPSTCDACHHSDYTGVTDPNHISAGFSTACTECHTTTAWSPANYNHNLSGFPLTGAHATVTCNSCHATGYTGTPSECFACHSGDYNTATPDHLAAGFPTTCQTCHSTTAWTPANWNHDAQYFPIYSGKHREKWNDCTDCHVNPASFATFECIFCHEHNQTSMDDKHKERQGYQYLSTACLGCHPRGD